MPTLFYSSEELSAILGLKLRTLQNLAKEGKIPGAVQFGREWRFDREAVEGHTRRTLPAPKGNEEEGNS